MADVKAAALVLALGDAIAEKQAETLIETLFKEKAKTLMAAMDVTVEDKEPNTLSKHQPM